MQVFFLSYVAQCMQKLVYHLCDAHPDSWMNAHYRPEDKLQYYSFILSYMDHILCIQHDPDSLLNKLNGYVPFKPRSIRSPDIYLGMKLKCIQLHNGIWAWSMSPSKYVQEAVRIYKEYVAKHLNEGYKLPKRVDNHSRVAISLCIPSIGTR